MGEKGDILTFNSMQYRSILHEYFSPPIPVLNSASNTMNRKEWSDAIHSLLLSLSLIDEKSSFTFLYALVFIILSMILVLVGRNERQEYKPMKKDQLPAFVWLKEKTYINGRYRSKEKEKT